MSSCSLEFAIKCTSIKEFCRNPAGIYRNLQESTGIYRNLKELQEFFFP
jgi:hypothetical protein